MKEAFYRLAAGEGHQAEEIEWVAKDGVRRLIAWSATAQIGEDGSVSHVIGTGMDITDWRSAEIRLQRLQAELAGQGRGDEALTGELESIKGESDSFNAEMPCDLRSPLRWISGFCQALEVAGAHRLDFRGRRYLRRLRRMIRQTGDRKSVV